MGQSEVILGTCSGMHWELEKDVGNPLGTWWEQHWNFDGNTKWDYRVHFGSPYWSSRICNFVHHLFLPSIIPLPKTMDTYLYGHHCDQPNIYCISHPVIAKEKRDKVVNMLQTFYYRNWLEYTPMLWEYPFCKVILGV
jgi:hypothetical protein